MIQHTHHTTGETLYAVVYNTIGEIRDVVAGAWDSITDADSGDYDIPLVEQDTDTKVYQASEPAGLDTTTHYPYVVYRQVGGSPSLSADDPLGGGTLNDIASLVNVVLGPLVGVKDPVNRVSSPITLETFEGASKTYTLAILDADGDPVDLTGKSLRWMYETDVDPPVSQTKVETPTITIATSVVTVPTTATDSAASGRFRWRLWNTTDNLLLQHGPYIIRASQKDTS